ncbi:hypothetical protein GCM10010522_38820 [Kribbella solani]|uniref:Uncharacterized protein n=1 Tax=Kribbella solani TaxID=236067 RepID=A0A841DWT8_9ACTN|nr:hypothetical protein [Kribbella solani]
MAIARSQNELAAEMDEVLAEPPPSRDTRDDYRRGRITFLAWVSAFAADECFHCGEDIKPHERPFVWAGHPFKFHLTLHQRCLREWLPKVQADLERCTE